MQLRRNFFIFSDMEGKGLKVVRYYTQSQCVLKFD